MKVADQHDELDDTKRLIGLEGMTAEQFAGKTAAMRGIEAPAEDDLPGSIVMRADYDNARAALAAENEDFALMTDGNRSVADAMVALVQGVRLFSRQRSLQPKQVAVSIESATEQVLVLKVREV